MSSESWDSAIVGGGVGGLALAIRLAKAGHSVVLFEREAYPFHKVCGEYISTESLSFLAALGLDLGAMEVPHMSRLLMSSPSGIAVRRKLDVGGVGLSRYRLDAALAGLARGAGVQVVESTKVKSVTFEQGGFSLSVGDETVRAKTAAGAYGMHSNIDVQLGRDYKKKQGRQLFVAVKHHIRADYDPAFVEIHNFPGGYCGMSAIEDGLTNLSYIVQAAHLKAHGAIPAMERALLGRNPYLKRYFDTATFVFPRPLTISHLHFGMKSPVTNRMLMLGDAAGNIAPLSGNGMSMSLQSAKLAAAVMDAHLKGGYGLEAMTADYVQRYTRAFRTRIAIARQIHYFFGKPGLTDWGFRLLRLFPGLVDLSGKMIHGKDF